MGFGIELKRINSQLGMALIDGKKELGDIRLMLR